MPVPMHKCPHCEKRMPKHILDKHLEKYHLDKSIKEVTSIQQPVTSIKEPDKWYERWDAGELQECKTCHETYPAKLMPFHVKLIHGL